MKMPFLKTILVFVLSATASVHALPLNLAAPTPNLGALDRDGTLLTVDDLREADFGGGLRFPVRWVYRSSVQANNPYGWAGFTVPLLESRAVKRTGILIEVTMLSGEVEYFTLQPNQAPAVWKSNDTQWTGVEDGTKFTITRWDGWEIEFRNGLIYRLKTDDNRTLRWESDTTDPSLVTRIYEPQTNNTVVTVGLSNDPLEMMGSSTLRGARTLTVNGDAYTLSYDGGTLKDIAFPDGRKTQWRFESVAGNGKRLTLTQETGWWRSWVFDATSRRVKTDDYWNYTITGGEPAEDGVVYNRPTVERTRVATGENEKWIYEASNSIRKAKDVLGNELISYKYQTVGKLYNKTFKLERKAMGTATPVVTWRGVYDAATGDLISSFDAFDNQTAYAYERFSAANEFQPPKKVTITDPLGRARVIERDIEGNVIEVVDPAGVKRKLEYDSRRRLTRVKNATNQVLLRFVYGDKDEVLEQYDALDNKTSFEYITHLGELLLKKVTTPEGRVSELFYDTKGRLTKLKSSSGAEWSYTYAGDWSEVAKIIDPLNAETNFEYDTRLNRIKVTDALSRVTLTAYDDLDLPSEVTDALGQKTQIENNGNGDMKKLTDARNNAYNLAWEEEGMRKSLQWPDAAKQSSEYDANGDLSVWKAKGNAGNVTISRNAAAELTARSWTAGTESGSASITRNAAGQTTAATATTLGMTIDQALTYDADGRVASLAQTYGGTTRTASATYDLAGRLATITYPAGFVVGYEYNKDGQIASIKKGGTALATYAYDVAGRLATRTLANGVVSTYSYDAANRLDSIVVANGATVLWAERYGYNAAGERIFTLKGATGTVGDGYWLDATSQLRGVKYGSPNAALGYASQNGQTDASEWQYDAVGNRLAQLGSAATTYVANTINQYTTVLSVPTVAYSARGDLTQFGDWNYVYDATGNLIRAHNTQSNRLAKYGRDFSGHRAVEDVDGTKTVYFNWDTNPLEAWQVASSTSSSTIYEPGIDQPLAEIGNSGSVAFFYEQDWLGNVVLLTNAQGQVSESYSYDVWGKVTAKDGAGQPVQTPQSRFLFTGREFDTETGLYHYRARAYSAELGRFLQTDPIDFDAGDVNLFRYVGNQPMDFIDAFGLAEHISGARNSTRNAHEQGQARQKAAADRKAATPQKTKVGNTPYNRKTDPGYFKGPKSKGGSGLALLLLLLELQIDDWLGPEIDPCNPPMV